MAAAETLTILNYIILPYFMAHWLFNNVNYDNLNKWLDWTDENTIGKELREALFSKVKPACRLINRLIQTYAKLHYYISANGNVLWHLINLNVMLCQTMH